MWKLTHSSGSCEATASSTPSSPARKLCATVSSASWGQRVNLGKGGEQGQGDSRGEGEEQGRLRDWVGSWKPAGAWARRCAEPMKMVLCASHEGVLSRLDAPADSSSAPVPLTSRWWCS